MPVPNPFTVDAPKTRSGRIRRTRDLGNTSECTCGNVVSPEEISAAVGVIECKRANRGCETKWVRCLLFDVYVF